MNKIVISIIHQTTGLDFEVKRKFFPEATRTKLGNLEPIFPLLLKSQTQLELKL